MKTKFLTVFSTLLLTGCETTYVPQVIQPVPCGKDLEAKYLEECVVPKDLTGQPTPLDMVNRAAELKKALRDCAAKSLVLQRTLKACQSPTEKEPSK